MKRLSNTLSEWSKVEFRDIIKNIREFEGRFKDAEGNFIQNNSATKKESLQEINAQYIRYLKLEEVIIK